MSRIKLSSSESREILQTSIHSYSQKEKKVNRIKLPFVESNRILQTKVHYYLKEDLSEGERTSNTVPLHNLEGEKETGDDSHGNKESRELTLKASKIVRHGKNIILQRTIREKKETNIFQKNLLQDIREAAPILSIRGRSVPVRNDSAVETVGRLSGAPERVVLGANASVGLVHKSDTVTNENNRPETVVKKQLELEHEAVIESAIQTLSESETLRSKLNEEGVRNLPALSESVYERLERRLSAENYRRGL